jgi:hypothetical protein
MPCTNHRSSTMPELLEMLIEEGVDVEQFRG